MIVKGSIGVMIALGAGVLFGPWDEFTRIVVLVVFVLLFLLSNAAIVLRGVRETIADWIFGSVVHEMFEIERLKKRKNHGNQTKQTRTRKRSRAR